MAVTDTVGDLLCRLRNGSRAHQEQVTCPASRLGLQVVRVLRAEGYVQKYDLVDDRKQGLLRVTLKYGAQGQAVIQGLKRVSRPGRRVYVGRDEVPSVLGGLGVAILTTSRGVVSDRQARRQGIGGEVLCQVW